MNLKELARKAISTLFLSMLCLVAFAQGRQVNGTVKDAAGEPMIGVNVLVKGTTNGTIPLRTSMVIFRFLGLKTMMFCL